METELPPEETRFRQIIRKLPLPLSIMNHSGEHTYINDRFVEVFGYLHEEIPTRAQWSQLAYPDVKYRNWVAETWAAEVKRAAKEGQDIGPMEYNITCKNGSVRAVLVSGIAIGEEVLAIFTDITERRRHEQAMKAAYERRRINDLMHELTQEGPPSKQAVYESARIMGANMMAPYSCFLIVIDEHRKKTRAYWQEHLDAYQLLIDSILEALEEANRLCWESPEGIGVLCFETTAIDNTKEKQKQLAEKMRNTIARQELEVIVSVGIAEPAVSISDIRNHYRQAVNAVGAGRKLWPQLRIYHYLEMGVFQVLSCFNDEAQIASYIERTLGKLLHYDKNKRQTFLDTLEIILMSDNLKEGAGKLSIHYQTLMFRKQRLEQILGVSFDDFSSRMAILTALHLLKLRKY
jgi:PAS domain S-box-containing protein